ncbi:MAG: cell division protein ZapA (FtsZ GTPase activity inhibitor) [Flavobacteriales bacterium]|jgi:cell division protein ZapA (FtsZ GTPase activity inhibitor)
MDQLSIKVTIAGRMYPLTIDPSEEESIRKAAAEINANVKNLQENYAVKDMQDLLSMAALQFATELTKGKKLVEYNKLQEEIDSVNNLLDKHLES